MCHALFLFSKKRRYSVAHKIDNSKLTMTSRPLHGRRIIKSGATYIHDGNVIEVLKKALESHHLNQNEINYLYSYYKGEQPILHREKTVRPGICNRIVENRANEIVSFKVGYLCGEPIQYICRNSESKAVEEIGKLNEMMSYEDKMSKDQEIVEWQMICGTSYRLVLPDNDSSVDEVPFEIHTLDPRDAFVVYSNEIGDYPLMGVKQSIDEFDVSRYSIYTNDTYYLIENDCIVQKLPHTLGTIPIFEYPANNARLGSFEIVIPLLDAINNIASNRLDGIEQFIQSFIKFINCDIDEEGFKDFLNLGAIKVKSSDGQKADVDIVVSELNQDQTQTLKEDLYNSVLTICGMPNRNGGSSTSDTGTAVHLRDGWSLAESRAKDSEHIFKKSEKAMLRLVLKLCHELSDFSLTLRDIDTKFTRRNYEAIQSKAQVLVSMLGEEKIHPRLAFLHSGLFTDAESAYTMSDAHYKEFLENQPAVGKPLEQHANYVEETTKNV